MTWRIDDVEAHQHGLRSPIDQFFRFSPLILEGTRWTLHEEGEEASFVYAQQLVAAPEPAFPHPPRATATNSAAVNTKIQRSMKRAKEYGACAPVLKMSAESVAIPAPHLVLIELNVVV